MLFVSFISLVAAGDSSEETSGEGSLPAPADDSIVDLWDGTPLMLCQFMTEQVAGAIGDLYEQFHARSLRDEFQLSCFSGEKTRAISNAAQDIPTLPACQAQLKKLKTNLDNCINGDVPPELKFAGTLITSLMEMVQFPIQVHRLEAEKATLEAEKTSLSNELASCKSARTNAEGSLANCMGILKEELESSLPADYVQQSGRRRAEYWGSLVPTTESDWVRNKASYDRFKAKLDNAKTTCLGYAEGTDDLADIEAKSWDGIEGCGASRLCLGFVSKLSDSAQTGAHPGYGVAQPSPFEDDLQGLNNEITHVLNWKCRAPASFATAPPV